MPNQKHTEVMALKVNQWLSEWNSVPFNPKKRRDRPQDCFYIFTLSALDLRALSDVYVRTTAGGKDRVGIQRHLDKGRASEIWDYVQHGYPFNKLKSAERALQQYQDLRKPGWLPTAIVVNILKPGQKRRGNVVDKNDEVRINDAVDNTARIILPSSFGGATWQPKQLHPIEIIDGQHRLFAFDNVDLLAKDHFDIPVVAFYGLDESWQAYLFWTINISPKRINPSLAFDLYPLLRTEDWLERTEGPVIYRETRAQELTETLWSHPSSPWYQRINMLGEKGSHVVSQAAWIRSLLATFVKSFEGKGVSIGGLYGAPVGSQDQALPWTRVQQAAFLIFVGTTLRDAISESNVAWAADLRQGKSKQLSLRLSNPTEQESDPAFYGSYTLLNSDQGVRGFLHVVNDLCFVMSNELTLEKWEAEDGVGVSEDHIDDHAVNVALSSLRKQPTAKFLFDMAKQLTKFDWRTSSAPGLSDQERLMKAAFRGSGGYRELRHQLLVHLTRGTRTVASASQKVLKSLGY